ncbi:MAG: FkbM family methyltransferase [Cyanobium sp.]
MKQVLKKFTPRPLLDLRRDFIFSRMRQQLSQQLSVSQAGQDFWVYAEAFNLMKHGYFVDIGAHDGIFLSNTFILESRYSWRGICVEANPLTFLDLSKNRNCDCANVCIDSVAGTVDFALRGTVGGIIDDQTDNNGFADLGSTIKVGSVALVDLLMSSGSPKVIDYLTMDIEGAEDRALLGFPFADYLFRAITIERPSPKLRDKLSENGYILVKEVPGLDCFYIHSSFLEDYLVNSRAFYSSGRSMGGIF